MESKTKAESGFSAENAETLPTRTVWHVTKEAIKTALLCALYWGAGFVVVFLVWPHARTAYESLHAPDWIPSTLSTVGGFLILFVLTHMGRKQMDGNGYPFICLYGVAGVLFGLTTVPASQYNTGLAMLQVAFVTMIGIQLAQKIRGDFTSA